MRYPHQITITAGAAATFDATSGNPTQQPGNVVYSGKCFRQDAPRGYMTRDTGDEMRQADEFVYLPRGEYPAVVEDVRFDNGDFKGRVTERTYARGRFYTKLVCIRDRKN